MSQRGGLNVGAPYARSRSSHMTTRPAPVIPSARCNVWRHGTTQMPFSAPYATRLNIAAAPLRDRFGDPQITSPCGPVGFPRLSKWKGPHHGTVRLDLAPAPDRGGHHRGARDLLCAAPKRPATRECSAGTRSFLTAPGPSGGIPNRSKPLTGPTTRWMHCSTACRRNTRPTRSRSARSTPASTNLAMRLPRSSTAF